MTSTREERIQELGHRIFDMALEAKSDVLKTKDWETQVLKWCMKNPRLKTKILRFVDVLPSLQTHRDIVTHMKEYFPNTTERMPLPLRMGRVLVTPSLLTGAAAAHAIRWAVRRIALHLIAAESLKEVDRVLKKMDAQGNLFTIDLLGEAVKSEAEADTYTERVLETIDFLFKSFSQRTDRPAGTIGPRVNVSVKPSALFSHFDPLDTEGSVTAVRKRLSRILHTARRRSAFINLDMEQYEYRDLTLRIFKEALSDKAFSDFQDVGIALQAYHRDSERVLVDLLDWVKKRRTPVTVRLIKGAYWDYEVIRAKQNNWSIPVYLHKHETDMAFEHLTEMLLQNHEHIHTAIGSHNIRSIAHAIALAEEMALDKKAVEYQLLFGMAEPIQQVLIQLGLSVRVYTPFGELIPGMGYLVRRILENTSNESFLRQGFLEAHISPDVLLEDPKRMALRAPKPQIVLDETSSTVEGMPPFRNEPLTDFTHEEDRRRMREAIQATRHTLGKELAPKIDGKDIKTPNRLKSTNPCDPNETIVTVGCANRTHARQAVHAAIKAQRAWGARPVEERAQILFKTAEGMRRKRFELAALQVLEVGKGWREADADVCEAIDYLDYYGRQAMRIQKPVLTQQIPGETNTLLKQPLGAGAVISPWNFPLAIPAGMTSAALVTGNSVVIKPAEQSPAVAHCLIELFEQAGLPPGVLNYLPGIGEEAGDELVKSPDLKFIAFTGSREVGLAILAQTHKPQKGEYFIKRIVTEMGGKNALIIDSDADLDEAVHGIIQSAFGFQGQKCSACSRVIILSDIYDLFLKRLVEAVRSLHVGRPEKPSTHIGPLIDPAALEKAREYVRIGKIRHRVAFEYPQENLPQEGHFFGPVIFSDVGPDSPLAQEEIFAPVLSCMRAENFEDALRIANRTAYALTAGLYSRNPAHIRQAGITLEAGNFYVNRPITGAVVGRQPFGGFKLSGTGQKAGGQDYLEHFLITQTVSENTLRHGFAPL